MSALPWAELVAGVLLLGNLALRPQVADLRLREWHHGYLGILVFGAGLLVAIGWHTGGLVLQWTGFVLTADDSIQHAVQRLTGRHQFAFLLHRLYALVWPWAPIQRLNAWLDKRAE